MSYKIHSPMDRGALGLVLKLSRIAGVAPYTHAPEFQVSRTLSIYGKIFIVINGILVFSCIVGDFYLTPDSDVMAIQIVGLLLTTVLTATTTIGVFTASARVTRMAEYMKKLNQFNEKLCKAVQNKINYKIFGFIAVFNVLLVIDFLQRGTLFPNLNFVSRMNNALIMLNMFLLTLLLLQITFFVLNVKSYLTALNDKLKHLISEGKIGPKVSTENLLSTFGNDEPMTSQNITNDGDKNVARARANKVSSDPVYLNVNAFVNTTKLVKRRSILRQIRELATLYQLMCEIIVLKTNEADGVIVLLFIVFAILYLEEHLVLGIILCSFDFSRMHIVPSVVFRFSFALYGVAFIILFVEQFHQTHSEMNQTNDLIQNRKPIEYDAEVEHELELFHRMLILIKVTYSPLDLFTIDRELVMKLFSCLITYMVITFEYGPETRNLFASNATLSSEK